MQETYFPAFLEGRPRLTLLKTSSPKSHGGWCLEGKELNPHPRSAGCGGHPEPWYSERAAYLPEQPLYPSWACRPFEDYDPRSFSELWFPAYVVRWLHPGILLSCKSFTLVVAYLFTPFLKMPGPQQSPESVSCGRKAMHSRKPHGDPPQWGRHWGTLWSGEQKGLRDLK